jgi:DNA-binding PadR family transcriptional regulator
MPGHLSALEQLVLIALMRLDGDAYGITVQSEIAARTGREPGLGTVYAALTRLEEKGFAVSHLGDATHERGGRRKKIFVLSTAGKRVLRESIRDIRVMTRGLDALGGLP